MLVLGQPALCAPVLFCRLLPPSKHWAEQQRVAGLVVKCFTSRRVAEPQGQPGRVRAASECWVSSAPFLFLTPQSQDLQPCLSETGLPPL